MPVTYLTIIWPNNEEDQVYSPSSVIKEFFTKESELKVDDFLITIQNALNESSERVRMKFGFACTSAESELNRIRHLCQQFKGNQRIKIKAFK